MQTHCKLAFPQALPGYFLSTVTSVGFQTACYAFLSEKNEKQKLASTFKTIAPVAYVIDAFNLVQKKCITNPRLL